MKVPNINSERWLSVESFDGEIWKSVHGFSDYLVSNYGRIMTLKYGREKILKSHRMKNGYHITTLSSPDFGQRHYLVHRIVAIAFCNNENGYSEVNHKDENKNNNCASNLEWCSHKYNMNYGTLSQRMSDINTANPSLSIPVEQYDEDGNYIQTFGSVREVFRKLKMRGYKKIYQCFDGNPVYCHGYIWKRKEI